MQNALLYKAHFGKCRYFIEVENVLSILYVLCTEVIE